jgi:hypothetical protein
MRFDELSIVVALFRTEGMIADRIQNGENLPPFGSDMWLTTHRNQLLSMIQSKLMVDESLLDYYLRYRKSSDKKMRLMAEVAERFGARCFYRDRGKGACSEECDLDRIIPGSRGGEYKLENCHIACSKHNRERGDKTIEEYLSP